MSAQAWCSAAMAHSAPMPRSPTNTPSWGSFGIEAGRSRSRFRQMRGGEVRSGSAAAIELLPTVFSLLCFPPKNRTLLPQRWGTSAHLIDGAADIQFSWLKGVSTIGLTAGASAPPAVVEEIISALSGLGPLSVSERVTTMESIWVRSAQGGTAIMPMPLPQSLRVACRPGGSGSTK